MRLVIWRGYYATGLSGSKQRMMKVMEFMTEMDKGVLGFVVIGCFVESEAYVGV